MSNNERLLRPNDMMHLTCRSFIHINPYSSIHIITMKIYENHNFIIYNSIMKYYALIIRDEIYDIKSVFQNFCFTFQY